MFVDILVREEHLEDALTLRLVWHAHVEGPDQPPQDSLIDVLSTTIQKS